MLIARAIISIVALIFVIFSIYHLKTTGVSKSLFYLDPQAVSSFNTSEVSHLEWDTLQRTFVFDKTPSGSWFPEEKNKKVSDLITFLSQIKLNEVVQKGSPAIKVSITIKQEVWTGAWDGMSFVWTSGPQKGFGEVLKQEKNMAFFKGKYVFDEVKVNLCQNRVNKIHFSMANSAIQINQEGRHWVAVTNKGQKNVDPIFIEKWLVGLCKVQARSKIDLSLAPVSKTLGFLQLDYADKKSLSFRQIEKDFYIHNEAGVVMEGLGLSMKRLCPPPIIGPYKNSLILDKSYKYIIE